MSIEELKSKNVEYPTKSLEYLGVKLLDCVHKTPKPATSGYPYIAIPNIKGGRLDLKDVRLISEEDYQEWTKKTTPRAGDIILTRRARVGDIAVIPEDLKCAIGQNLVILRSNEKQVLQRYLKWTLGGPLYEQEVYKYLNVGAVFDSLNCKDIPKFEIPVPTIQEQNEIADILDSLDDKIDLNNQMNSNLEYIAQTLFKHWFIDFEFPDENGNPYRSSGGRMVDSELREIPEGWRIGSLGEFCEITMGQSPPGKTYNEEGCGIPFYQGITDFGFRFPSQRIYCTEPKRFAEKDDVLLSVRAPVGSLNVADQKYAIGRGLAALRLKQDHGGYLYYSLKAIKSRWNVFESEGTVFGSIGKSDIQNFETIIPSQNLIFEFNTMIRPIDERISINEKQNLILSSIRDSLLPKLISGKIRVKLNSKEILP